MSLPVPQKYIKQQIELKGSSSSVPLHILFSRRRLNAVSCVVKASSSDENNIVKTTFRIHKHVNYGSNIAVTGSVTELGQWNPKAALHLNWSDGDNWFAEKELPPQSAFDYKYIICHGQSVDWQPGNNYTLSLPAAGRVEVTNSWEGHSHNVVVTKPTIVPESRPSQVQPLPEIHSLSHSAVLEPAVSAPIPTFSEIAAFTQPQAKVIFQAEPLDKSTAASPFVATKPGNPENGPLPPLDHARESLNTAAQPVAPTSPGQPVTPPLFFLEGASKLASNLFDFVNGSHANSSSSNNGSSSGARVSGSSSANSGGNSSVPGGSRSANGSSGVNGDTPNSGGTHQQARTGAQYTHRQHDVNAHLDIYMSVFGSGNSLPKASVGSDSIGHASLRGTNDSADAVQAAESPASDSDIPDLSTFMSESLKSARYSVPKTENTAFDKSIPRTEQSSLNHVESVQGPSGSNASANGHYKPPQPFDSNTAQLSPNIPTPSKTIAPEHIQNSGNGRYPIPNPPVLNSTNAAELQVEITSKSFQNGNKIEAESALKFMQMSLSSNGTSSNGSLVRDAASGRMFVSATPSMNGNGRSSGIKPVVRKPKKGGFLATSCSELEQLSLSTLRHYLLKRGQPASGTRQECLTRLAKLGLL